LHADFSVSELRNVLSEFGIVVTSPEGSIEPSAFPIVLTAADGRRIALELPQPPLVSELNPKDVGFAVVSSDGQVRAAWGLATGWSRHGPGAATLAGPLSECLTAATGGERGTCYADGLRFHWAPLEWGRARYTLVMVLNASEEQAQREAATRNEGSAATLKRLGRVLTMNQHLKPMASEALHEIVSSMGLAAGLLWTLCPESQHLKLVAAVGVNRLGMQSLERLNASGGSSCMAEIVAATKRTFQAPSLEDNPATEAVEAKICYLPTGGVYVAPLVIGNQLIGVLELIGRADDPAFLRDRELLTTVTEHLSLAVNGAMIHESCERLASFDPLTGVANHRSMLDFLHARLAEARRVGSPLGVLMLDVDHFRSFNDEEGHDAGDAVLQLVARAIGSCLRPYDLAARYGGEEFTIIMPGAGAEETLRAAERIRTSIEAITYTTRSGRQRHVTASIGCAVFPGSADDAFGLLKAADTALYQAKRSGRNRVVMFEGRYVSEPLHERLDLAAIEALLPPGDREAGARLARFVEARLPELAAALKLSATQSEILRGLALAAPAYRCMVADGDRENLTRVRNAPEFRLLLPSLEHLDERYDGGGDRRVAGERIPLLARVLAAIMAVHRDGGRDLVEDPGRYDPEIVAIIAGLPSAA